MDRIIKRYLTFTPITSDAVVDVPLMRIDTSKSTPVCSSCLGSLCQSASSLLFLPEPTACHRTSLEVVARDFSGARLENVVGFVQGQSSADGTRGKGCRLRLGRRRRLDEESGLQRKWACIRVSCGLESCVVGMRWEGDLQC